MAKEKEIKKEVEKIESINQMTKKVEEIDMLNKKLASINDIISDSLFAKDGFLLDFKNFSVISITEARDLR